MFKQWVVGGCCVLLLVSEARAQEPFNIAVQPAKLATFFTELYGPNGLIVESLAVLPTGETHSAHFNSAFQTEFTQLGVALTSQLASVPLPSPAASFTYELDPQLGVFTRSTESFGPILAERAETLGAGRFSFGFTYQRFDFDTIEGLDLGSVPAVFTHDDFERRGGREDLVTTVNSINAEVNQFTAFLTYGLTDRLDLSLAIPLVSTDLTVVSDATVQRIGTVNPEIHFFRTEDDSIGTRRMFTAFGTASGLGDITLRIKGTLKKSGSSHVGLGLDVRVPTGDENDLLGVGAAGVRPFFIWSVAQQAISPHVNFGYLWNGTSSLGGNPATGESADLPDQGFFTVGADFGVGSRFTFAIDVIGQYILDAPRLVRENFLALDGVSVFPNIRFVEESYEQVSGAVGFKLNVASSLLVDFNLLFKMDDNGLRDKVTPLIGFEYSF